MKNQTTSTILMIRPVNFNFNEETAANNYYQKVLEGLSAEKTQEQAIIEFDTFVEKLRSFGIKVIVIEDTQEPYTPDSIFPNNWISFHQDGGVALYPMFAESRRGERRSDIIDNLAGKFQINGIIDLTGYEQNQKYLEGTGSMILDRPNGIVYAAVSERTDKHVLDVYCRKFNYKAITFVANQMVAGQRLPIYHTNVMMSVADDFAIICLDAIDDSNDKEDVVGSLKATGKEIIEITEQQENHFAGNMLQVHNEKGEKYLVMSSAAFKSLDKTQIQTIEKHCAIIHSSLDTIEACGGGSARCMMAEVFLPPKS